MKPGQRALQDVTELITGGWRAQAVHTAVLLGIPDHIEAGHTHSADIAAVTDAKEEGIHRLMRLLRAMGVFEGNEQDGYRNTPVSSLLLDRPSSMRDLCLLYGQEFYTAWGHAPEAISRVRSGFEEAYGQPLYSYLVENEDISERFQRAMTASGRFFFDTVPEAFDFSGGKKVVDIGGGNGNLLSAVLKAAPDARGVLLDRENVVSTAGQGLIDTFGPDRVELVGGSMLDGVPGGGDVYVVCRALAGYSDDETVGVFTSCRQAMADSSSRLLVLDRLVDDDSPVLPALWDLHMLITTGGRHRSADRFQTLLDRAGLDVERIAELPVETTVLIAAPRL